MATRLKRPPARGLDHTVTAFGVPFVVESGIDLEGVGFPDPSGAGAVPTRVAVDPRGLRRAWEPNAPTLERMREVRDGEELFLAIDVVPETGYLISTRDVGSVFVAADGMTVLCDPKPGVEYWPVILTAQVLPLVATLRGFELLHASGVVVRGSAVLFSAPPGHGKSSLAAAMVRAGAGLLSDDAVALEPGEGRLVAHPGCGHIDLRTPEHERLSEHERAQLPAPAAFVDKHRYTVGVQTSTAPLGALFLIEWSARGNAIERLETVSPFELIATTRTSSVRDPARLLRQLETASAIAATGRVYRLRVRPGLDATALAGLVEEELATWL